MLAPGEIFIPQKLALESLSKLAESPEKKLSCRREIHLGALGDLVGGRWPGVCSRVHL